MSDRSDSQVVFVNRVQRLLTIVQFSIEHHARSIRGRGLRGRRIPGCAVGSGRLAFPCFELLERATSQHRATLHQWTSRHGGSRGLEPVKPFVYGTRPFAASHLPSWFIAHNPAVKGSISFGKQYVVNRKIRKFNRQSAIANRQSQWSRSASGTHIVFCHTSARSAP
jgi:hypothetical protein